MKRRILSIATALALCLSLCPTWAFAAGPEPDTGLCAHHTEHTDDCGYIAPSEGQPCNHEHMDDCYTIAEDGSEVLDCQHTHDSECGYIQATPGASCGYECPLCPIEALIAALPRALTADNAETVRWQLDEILDLWRELSEDEREQIDLSPCWDLQAALDEANAPVTAAVGDVVLSTSNPSVTFTAEECGDSCAGHTITQQAGTLQGAIIIVESGTHNVTFSGLNITPNAHVGVMPNATMNLALMGTNTIQGSECGIYVPEGATLVIDGSGSLTVSASDYAAGIGGAFLDPSDSSGWTLGNLNCGTIVINGGTITATGAELAAGIGGATCDGYNIIDPGNGGNVTINGGTVTATGRGDGQDGGAGIGGGTYSENSTKSGSGGTLTINGGNVTLTAGHSTAYGFGRGSGTNNVNAGTLTLADASCLTLTSGTTLDPNGTYSINGDPTPDMIVVPTDLVYTGQTHDLTGKIYIDDTKTGTTTLFDRTFSVTASANGWDYTISPAEVKEAGDYTVTFTKGGKPISKTFTVARSGTEFTGDVKTYNGETETTSFTASDTITVKATPSATGAAPAAMMAASFTQPTASQMALFVGDTQVSEPVNAEDGTYTMNASASDVLTLAGVEPNGAAIPLTAKFVGTSNMADAAATVAVTISASVKVQIGNATTYYGGIDPAWTAACAAESATVTLLDNVTAELPLNVSNGDWITLNGGSNTLSMIGFGVIGGQLDITGGIFEMSNGLVVPGGTVHLSGGTFRFGSGGGIGCSSGSVANLLLNYGSTNAEDEHYAYFDEAGKPIALTEGQTTLTDTVTVKQCVHLGVTATPNGNGTHSLKCPYCGYTEAAADCSYGTEYQHDDTHHWQTCTVCGYENKEAHNWKFDSASSGNVIENYWVCFGCGRTKDHLTLTITVPTGLTYGNTEGKQVTCTVSPEKTCDKVRWYFTTGGFPEFADGVLPADLSVGEHQFRVDGLMSDDTMVFSGSYYLTVSAAPLNGNMVTLSTESVTYSGAAQKPAVTVKQGETTLTEGTDYDVAYSTTDFTNAGTVKITVTGKGNYEGTVEKTYTIAQAPLTIKANDQTIAFGQSLDNTAVTSTGLCNGDSLDSITLDPSTGNVPGGTITPSGAVIRNSGKDVTGNYEITYETGKLTITPVEVALTFGDQTITYGETPALATADPASAVIAYSYTGTSSGDGWPTDVGTYTITAKVEANGNYGAASEMATLTINKAPLTITGAEISEKQYNGSKEAAVTSVTFSGLVNGEKLTAADYTAAGEFADASVGENKSVTVTVTLSNTTKANNYTLSSGTFAATGKIKKADATITTAPTASEITYGQALSASTLSGGVGSVAGTFAWTNGSEKPGAGTASYSVTFTPDDANYNTATVNVSVTVAKATPTITWSGAAQTVDYTGSAAAITAPTVTLVNGESFSGTISYSYSTGDSTSYTSGLPVNAGIYKVKASIAEQGNYTAAGSGEMTLTISKVNYTGAKTASTSAKFGTTATYDLAALLPDEAIAGTPTTSSDIFDGAPSVSDKALTYKLKANAEVDSTGDITVPVTATNYNDFSLTITVTVKNKDVPTLTVSPITVTYTGEAVPSSAIRGTAKVGDTTVPGSWSFAEGQNLTNVADSGTKNVTFSPTDTTLYGEASGTVVVTIRPASLDGAEITLDQAAFRSDGTAHSPEITGVTLDGVDLTGADYTADIPSETAPGTYTVTITGRGNYTGTAQTAFTINPVETVEIDQTDDNGHALRLEVETGLSTVPAALVSNENLNTPEKIEAALRTKVAEAMSDVGENIAVFDVTLQYKDGDEWKDVDPENFPSEGVTAILPYPDGTGATGWTFTVQHLISSGDKAGTMETLAYELTADGLKCKFSSLSPVAIGYQAATKPSDPVGPVDPTPTPPSSNPGGGWSVNTYAITIEKSEHGKVTSNRTNASSNSTVTLTVTPDSGYVLDTLTVTDSRGNELKLTIQGGGKYTFTMPSRAVTVRATFAPLPADVEQPCDGGADCPSHGFTDLGTVGTWYHEAVDYVLRNGLMNGYSNTMFGPNDNLSRAQLAQILYNKEGKPLVTSGSVFTDVADGQWYAPAITWAAANGIVGGYGNGRFGPDDNITREQLAVMLWRYAGSPAATDKELHFTDANKASGYALEALRWAVENGIINGVGNNLLDPGGLATRAQVAQMLMNFLKNE